MSRVEKHHRGNKEKPERERLIQARKERPQGEPEPQQQYYQHPEMPRPEQEPQPRPKKKKKRWRRLLFRAIIFCLLYTTGAFVLGHQYARWTGGSPETEEFNGFKSQNGGNNILLIGSDSRDGENARADSIMVLQLDGPGRKPKLVSFMRDTFVQIPDVGEQKLNAAYAFGGAELLRQTINQNFGLDCKYYMTVDFKTFEKVIDTMFPTGVTIDAEKDMSKYLEVPIQKGPQKMDGLTLLQYARFRMDEEGDFGRVRRQQQVMNAIFSQMKNPLTLLTLPFAAGKAIGYTSTNVPTTFFLKNSWSMVKGMRGVDRLTVPVENSWSYGETFDAGSVLIVDKAMNRDAIQRFLAK